MSIASEIQALNTNLTAAKNAVTSAGGTVGDTGLAGLASEIGTIPTGGGGGEVESKYIDFYDYDGTRLYSWTKQELDNATELPENPTHAGLTSRGWNWTLAQLRDQGTPMDVGQMYRPTDGKTHLFVDVDADTLEPRIELSVGGLAAGATVATIDWGDGSPTEDIVTTSTSSAVLGLDHTYSQTGRYEVTIDIPDAAYGKVYPAGTYYLNYVTCLAICSLWIGQDSPSNKTTVKNANYARQVKEIWVGKNIKLGINPFGRSGIEKVVLSDTLQEADFSHDSSSATNAGSLFYQCNFLKYYVIPTGLTMSNITANKASLFGSTGLEGSCLPYGSTIYINNNNKITARATPPKTSSYTAIGNSFTKIYLPDGLASLDALSAYVPYIKYPSSLTSVPNLYGVDGNSSVNPPTKMYYPTTLDFSDFTSIPTRASTSVNAANLPGLVIKVPAALEADWKADASWSNLADYIVGV